MSRRVTIRMPDDVYDLLVERAKVEQRTVSNLVILLLKQKLNVAANVAQDSTTGTPPQSNAE